MLTQPESQSLYIANGTKIIDEFDDDTTWVIIALNIVTGTMINNKINADKPGAQSL